MGSESGRADNEYPGGALPSAILLRSSESARLSAKAAWGQKTLAALKEHGAVYLNAIGGAAQYYADAMKVKAYISWKFGIPEAMWHLEVEGFAAIVTMDAHGNSLHADVEMDSLQKLSQFKDPVFI